MFRASPGGSHTPKAPTSLPRPPGTSTERGTLRDPEHPLCTRSIPGPEPRSSPFPAGLTCADGRGGIPTAGISGEGWHGGAGAALSPAPAGRRGPPPACTSGRAGKGGSAEKRLRFRARGGKDVTPRAGPARTGGCGHPRGGWQGVGCTPQRGFLGGLGLTGAAARRGSRRSESRSDGKPGARAATPAGTVWAWPGRGPGCPEIPQHRETRWRRVRA